MAATVRTYVGLVLLAIGAAVVLATLLGFLGSTWWMFDVLANFRAQYAIVLLLVAVLYGLSYAKLPAALFLAGAVVNLALIAPLFYRSPEPAASPQDVKIVSFNVQAGNARRSEIVTWLESEDADLIFLTEASSDWDAPLRGASLGKTVLAEPPPDRTFGIIALGPEGTVAQNLMVASRYQVVRVEHTIDDQAVVVFAAHPSNPRNRRLAEERNELLEAIAELVNAESDPVILIGDLNVTPWSHAFGELTRQASLHNSLEGYGLQASWPSNYPGLSIPIDHMLHTEELTTVTRDLGPRLGSDHRPLIVEVAIAAR